MTREDAARRITVLTVPDCPNAPLARERIAQALDRRAADVELVEVADETHAARLGMTGSPTVLIDRTDPSPAPGTVSSGDLDGWVVLLRVRRHGDHEGALGTWLSMADGLGMIAK
ncbi:hypothetical protein [Streptomyces sp. MBT53]|uniref:hypothetical protein n=1 Tax=Streptomyces sp. MBT53 TaxID=1488384 RepID=UPI001913F197|nr:hypothetical protein [Streptomyces sp. MBT53]MBK6014165.1 hypothetical protein [Streptomyces sp. MBT53]